MKTTNYARIYSIFVFLTFLGSAVYVSIRLILAPTVALFPDSTVRVKSDYVLMLLQCVFGIIAMLLPGLLIHRRHLIVPSNMLIAYAVFLYCALYLGEVQSFYYRVPHWDTILHTFSGVALGALGFALIGLLNKSKTVPLTLSPIFVAMFALCFALSLGVIWEIYEFAVDYILHTNMQKYAFESGELLVGQAALADTMKDLIVDAIGAFVMSVIGYVSLKYKKGWLEPLQFEYNAEK